MSRSAKWAFLTSFLSRFSQPVVSVVLAWFLLPEDYGIVAMAALVTGLAGVFQGMGLSQALVQREKDVERSASVAFSLIVKALKKTICVPFSPLRTLPLRLRHLAIACEARAEGNFLYEALTSR